MSADPEFLGLADILEIHRSQLENFGGADGLRDANGLESAIEQPRASYEGQYLHSDLFSMAAAYIYHLAQNHPFVDGNKRTALASGLVFLALNGVEVLDPEEELYGLMISVASGKAGKAEIVNVLERLPHV